MLRLFFQLAALYLPLAMVMMAMECHVLAATSTRPVVGVNMAGEQPAPVQRAVTYLEKTLKDKRIDFTRDASVKADVTIHIGLAGENTEIQSRLSKLKVTLPQSPESLVIARDGSSIVVSGSDARGVAYGVYELADRVAAVSDLTQLASALETQVESPYLNVRTVSMQMFNQDVEKSWYESERYWEWFFGMLARNRFNNFNMIWGHNTNYMIPPYAWMIEVPGYPDVRVKGLSDEQRARNLAHFQNIGRIAREHGVDLTIGLWTQLPLPTVFDGLNYGPILVENLPKGLEGGDYCAKGLQRFLELCPDVSAVQMRLNVESGIPHNKQMDYYKAQFNAMASAGRPMKLDLRFKSLHQATIDLAVNAGLKVNVSTKHWAEHMGLPFHPTWQEPAYSESRYGFGKLLKYPRNYTVTYQIWNGTSRLLLWGDPVYASRFARNSRLSEGDGFEVYMPLTYKGYGNDPGDWRIFADPSLEHFEWEQERYWPFYLAFGRWTYNPDTPLSVWDRAYEKTFGQGGAKVAQAQRQASEILPFITATTLYSANSWRFWPELLPCLSLDAYRAIQPSDYGLFYSIAAFGTKPAKGFRGEGWTSPHNPFVADAVANNINAKWTPIQISRKFDELAARTLTLVDEAQKAVGNPNDLQWQATAVDLRVLAGLARYHAAKKRAATDLEFFRVTKDAKRLVLVWDQVLKAQKAWQEIVKITEGRYNPQMVMGHSPKHFVDVPDRFNNHSGHWKDQQAEVDADVAYVAQLMEQHGVSQSEDVHEVAKTIRRYPGETPPSVKAVVHHKRVTRARAGQPVPIVARVESSDPNIKVYIHYRDMDQTKNWKGLQMARQSDGSYSVEIPGDAVTPEFDVQYRIIVSFASGGMIWPDWQKEDPYIVVPVER